MATITYLPEAKDDLQRLFDFIHPHSPQAAMRAIEQILTTIEPLSDFPEAGYVWDVDPNFRELPIRFGARGYVARYRVFEGGVYIVRIWHGLEER